MDKKLVGLVSLFFIAFFVLMAAILFGRTLTQLTTAKEDITPSSTNSLMFVWPLTSKADNQAQVNINVFVRSTNNKFIPNKLVTVSTTLGNIKVLSNTSDKNGQTSFALTSSVPGKAELSATIDNSIPISQKLTVQFN